MLLCMLQRDKLCQFQDAQPQKYHADCFSYKENVYISVMNAVLGADDTPGVITGAPRAARCYLSSIPIGR